MGSLKIAHCSLWATVARRCSQKKNQFSIVSNKVPPKSRHSGSVPPAAYRKHAGEISIIMGNFFLQYLARVYREFDGDLAMVIVLGEIGQHNVNHCFSGQGAACRIDQEKTNDPAVWQQLQPCNAFSLSAATGIPRETVRRKIAALTSKGWLTRNSKGEVFMTKAMVEHFRSDFDLTLLGEFLEIAKRVEALLAGKAPEA
jgi:hypothetical protein